VIVKERTFEWRRWALERVTEDPDQESIPRSKLVITSRKRSAPGIE
jgi:hypothetical protein